MTEAPSPPPSATNPLVLPLALIGGITVVLDAFVVFVFGGRVDLVPFLAFTTLVAGSAAGAAIQPRLVGHALAVVLGAASVAGSFAAFGKGMTPVLPVTLLVTGGLLGVLAFRSWQGDRASWSFLVAMTSVLFVCTFFGAPKVRGTIGVGIWLALILPGLFAVATIGLSVIHERYRTADTK